VLPSAPMPCLAVIDFETSGATPAQGARATEVAICLLEGGRIVDRYASLMNAGVNIPPFITQLTGITNEMVAAAPPAQVVMREAAAFVGARPMVAHNAAFDRQFWRSELAHCGLEASNDFACTLLLSRRLYPDAPNHKLGTLAQWFDLPVSGRAHRPWPTPRWPRTCWRACSTIWKSATAAAAQIRCCSWRCSVWPNSRLKRFYGSRVERRRIRARWRAATMPITQPSAGPLMAAR